MRKRSPHVVGRTVLGAPFAGRPTAPVARGNLSSRPPLRCVSAALDRLRTFGVTACNRVFHGAHGNVRRPTYAISRAQPAHLWRDAPDRRRPSSGGRGVGDAAPYGLCVWVGVSINHSCPPSGAELDAAGRRDQLHPRLPRCACLASTTQLMQSRGHSPHTIFTGAPTSSFLPRRAGVEARPYGMFGRAKRTGLRTGPFCAEMPAGVSGRVLRVQLTREGEDGD